QGNPLARAEREVQVAQNAALAAGIGKRNVTELKAAHDRPWRWKRIGFGPDRGLHLEEREQIGEEQRLIGHPRQGGEYLLNVTAGLKNRSREQSQRTQGESACHGS